VKQEKKGKKTVKNNATKSNKDKPANSEAGKSAIQLAREKFAAAKALKNFSNSSSFKGSKGKSRGTGANAGGLGV
jgi:nucleolar protein 9